MTVPVTPAAAGRTAAVLPVTVAASGRAVRVTPVTAGRTVWVTPVTAPVRPPAPVSAPPATPPGAVAPVTTPAAVASGPAVTPVRPAASPGSAAAGWLAAADPDTGETAPRRTLDHTLDRAANARRGGSGGGGGGGRRAAGKSSDRTGDRGADRAGGGAGDRPGDGACDRRHHAGGRGFGRGGRVRLGLGLRPGGLAWRRRTPALGDALDRVADPGQGTAGLAPLLGAPPGACPGGVLAAGPVLEPPDPPGKTSWVAARTADAAALATGAGAWFAPPLAAGAAGAGTLAAGAAGAGTLAAGAAGAGTLAAGAAGAGTLAAGAAGEEAALAAGAWLAGTGWPAELGWPAVLGWAGGCGAGGWPAEDGPWLPPLPGAVPAGPGRRLWAAPATEPAAEVTLPTGRPAVSPLTPAAAAEPEGCAEPGFCAEAGFWSADARPARSTAKTSAAAKPPHAYRQTLKASIKARERVADPSTANTLPPDPDIHPYPGTRRTGPHLRPCPTMGRLPARKSLAVQKKI